MAMDHYITIVANNKLMISDLRGQGHSGLPLQPLQSLEIFLLLLSQKSKCQTLGASLAELQKNNPCPLLGAPQVQLVKNR